MVAGTLSPAAHSPHQCSEELSPVERRFQKYNYYLQPWERNCGRRQIREIILTGCFSAFSYCNDSMLTKVTSRKKRDFASILEKSGQQELEAAGHATPTSGTRE